MVYKPQMNLSQPDLSFITDDTERVYFINAFIAVNELHLWDWLSEFKGSVTLTTSKKIRNIENQLMKQGIPYKKSTYAYIIHNMLYIATFGFMRWKMNVIIDQNENELERQKQLMQNL
jgi:hypothetical protein